MIHEVHNFSWGAAIVEQGSHGLHIGRDVIKETFEALAEIAVAEFAGGRGAETVLEAVAVAGEAHGALAARMGKGITF